VLRTPRSTQLRFSAWFGQYLDGFEYWNDAHDRSQAPDPQVSDSARWVAKYLPTGTAVLELGCGSGADARFLASCGFPVLATDFLTCPPGLLEFPEAGVSFVRMDIADPRGLMYLAELAKGLDRPPHIYARHVLDNGLGAWTRREVMGALAGFPDGTSLSVAVRLVEPSRRPGGSEPRGAISWPAFWEPSQRSGIEWVCVAEELGPTSTTLLWGRRTPGGSWWRRLPRSLDGLKSGCLGLSRYALRRAESLDARRAADAHSQPRGGPS
jgi:uncharacterized UPF0146 family protein